MYRLCSHCNHNDDNDDEDEVGGNDGSKFYDKNDD
jgi:hypothetical protein